MRLPEGYNLKCEEDFVYLQYDEKAIAVFSADGATGGVIWGEVFEHARTKAARKEKEKE